MKFALIKNGVVENVTVASSGYSNPDYDHTVDVTNLQVGPGFTYDGSFHAPVVVSISAHEVAKEKVLAAMDFGQDLMADYSAYNAVAGLSSEQILGIAQLLAPIQALVIAGSIASAKAVLETIAPNDSIGFTQTAKDLFLGKMAAYLAEQ